MSNTHVHHDRGPLDSAIKQPDGSVIVQGVAARVHGDGDPLKYPTGPEYRDAEALGELALRIVGTPVTVGHTFSQGDYATAVRGARAASVGSVTEARIDHGRLVVTMRLDSKRGADAIAKGQRELSVGYFASRDDSLHQRNMKPFELALVERARCGRACAILDESKAKADCGCGCTPTVRPSIAANYQRDRHALKIEREARASLDGAPLGASTRKRLIDIVHADVGRILKQYTPSDARAAERVRAAILDELGAVEIGELWMLPDDELAGRAIEAFEYRDHARRDAMVADEMRARYDEEQTARAAVAATKTGPSVYARAEDDAKKRMLDAIEERRSGKTSHEQHAAIAARTKPFSDRIK